MKPIVEEAFAELVRCGLLAEKPGLVYFNLLEEEDWKTVYFLVQKQAIIGICFSAVEALPEGLRPPSSIYLNWFGQVLYIKEGFRRMRAAVLELEMLFQANNIYPVLMKGLGMGCWYPRPELRMTGDIDFYIPKHYNEAVDYVENWGFKVTYMPNHDKFVYKDIWVEMHHQPIRFPLSADWKMESALISDGEVHYRVLDADSNALLLLTHAAKHLIGPGVGIRHLCDWVVFLQHNYPKVDFKKLRREVERLGLERFAIEFTALANDCFGMDFPGMEQWYRNSKPALKKRLWTDMLEKGDCGRESMKQRRQSKWLSYYATLTVRLWRFRVFCPGYVDRVAVQRIATRLKFVFKGNPFGNSFEYTREKK